MDIKGGLEPTREFTGVGDLGLQGVQVLDFWKWACSDLLANTTRGVLAEFIVGALLGAIDSLRKEWDSHDLSTPDGLRVEVKSSAYKQAWSQKEPSKISFSVGPTESWNRETGKWEGTPQRSAKVYVFCVLGQESLESPDPLDLTAWKFFVVPTATLNHELGPQKTAVLSTIERIAGPAVPASKLKEKVRALSAS